MVHTTPSCPTVGCNMLGLAPFVRHFLQVRLEDHVSISLGMKSIIFWDMSPCSPLSFHRRLGGTYRLHLQSQRNRFSKTRKQRTTRRHIPEDDTLHYHRCENLKSYISLRNFTQRATSRQKMASRESAQVSRKCSLAYMNIIFSTAHHHGLSTDAVYVKFTGYILTDLNGHNICNCRLINNILYEIFMDIYDLFSH
jgi:hypothetical protein